MSETDAVTEEARTERYNLRALYETSRLLSSSLDFSFVLSNLLLTAMSKLLVTRGLVLVYDEATEDHRVSIEKGIKELEEGDQVQVPAFGGEDVIQGDDVPEALQAVKIKLVLPIVTGARYIGAVALGGKATGAPYDSREMEFIASLVHMSSAAVQNSLMVRELKQANRDLDAKVQELNTLFDLSQEFNATIDRNRLAKVLSFALMGQMLVAKHLFVIRRNMRAEAHEQPEFDVVAAKGISSPAFDDDLMQQMCTLDEMVLLDGEPEGDDPWAALRDMGLRMMLPIQHQGATCGLLCLGPKMTGQPYGADDAEFLSALGNLAFVSIRNSYLVDEQIEKERLQEEMRLAANIQTRLLPSSTPSVEGLSVAAYAQPSREVGGDYYDIVPLENKRLLMAVADVTGKGMPASLLMANIQACLQMLVPMDMSLEIATAHINRVITANTDYDKFITYFAAVYHQETGDVDYVNAGHNPPMLLRSDGTLELLETGGLLLGVMAGMPYELGKTHLHPGDALVMFTDGVTEAMSPEEEEYGEERLEALLREHKGKDAEALRDVIREDIRVFTEDPETLSDDLTMIVAVRPPETA